jgi:hypothetical protein
MFQASAVARLLQYLVFLASTRWQAVGRELPAGPGCLAGDQVSAAVVAASMPMATMERTPWSWKTVDRPPREEAEPHQKRGLPGRSALGEFAVGTGDNQVSPDQVTS